MVNCPNCGTEIEDGSNFCKNCGAELAELPQNPTKPLSSAEDEVENAVVKRFDGLKNRDEAAIRALIDEHYYKFDEWAPYQRREAPEALKMELDSLKVIFNYSYELKDIEVNVLGDMAVATFMLHYWGATRNGKFDINSRVTSVLRKHDSGWKVVHEHFSKFPEEPKQSQFSFGRRFPL